MYGYNVDNFNGTLPPRRLYSKQHDTVRQKQLKVYLRHFGINVLNQCTMLMHWGVCALSTGCRSHGHFSEEHKRSGVNKTNQLGQETICGCRRPAHVNIGPQRRSDISFRQSALSCVTGRRQHIDPSFLVNLYHSLWNHYNFSYLFRYILWLGVFLIMTNVEKRMILLFNTVL